MNVATAKTTGQRVRVALQAIPCKACGHPKNYHRGDPACMAGDVCECSGFDPVPFEYEGADNPAGMTWYSVDQQDWENPTEAA